MTTKKLHDNEFDIETPLVARLLEGQFPQWAHLPLSPVAAPGTVHVLYRLGDAMVVRLPRIGVALEEVDKEHHWLPRLAPLLPVPIPLPLGRGRPTAEYPSEWSVYSWLEGENPVPGTLSDPLALAHDLAGFIGTLHSLDTAGAPRSERGRRSLEGLNASAREAIAQSHGLIDTRAATRVWELALSGAAWDGQAVWVHADLMPGNLLVREGRLSAVIDLGSLGTGDPASDLTAAWWVLPTQARATFRERLGVAEGVWNRGRGLALVIALQALPYYQHSNPGFAASARYAIAQVLDELEPSQF